MRKEPDEKSTARAHPEQKARCEVAEREQQRKAWAEERADLFAQLDALKAHASAQAHEIQQLKQKECESAAVVQKGRDKAAQLTVQLITQTREAEQMSRKQAAEVQTLRAQLVQEKLRAQAQCDIHKQRVNEVRAQAFSSEQQVDAIKIELQLARAQLSSAPATNSPAPEAAAAQSGASPCLMQCHLRLHVLCSVCSSE